MRIFLIEFLSDEVQSTTEKFAHKPIVLHSGLGTRELKAMFTV